LFLLPSQTFTDCSPKNPKKIFHFFVKKV
jgi:hypothetical protein